MHRLPRLLAAPMRLPGVPLPLRAAPLSAASGHFHSAAAALDRVLLADGVDEVATTLLEGAGHVVVNRPKLSADELMDIIGDFDAVVVRSASKITAEVLQNAPRLKVVGRAGTGVDNIDCDAASHHGVLVVNTPGGNTRSAAELAVSLITSIVRKVPQACADLKAGEFARSKYAQGTELRGKTLGVIGCGRIGQVVSRYATALGMKVIGFDGHMDDDALVAVGIEPVSLDELASRADVVTLHIPGGSDNKHLVDDKFLAACKDGVFVINAARGGVVHEGALLEALESGKVAGAALDVFEKEPKAPAFELSKTMRQLVAHPNVISTPHLGASTEEAQVKVAHDIAQQLCDGLAGMDWIGVVNAPHVGMAADADVQPWCGVSEAVGSMVAQLHNMPSVRSVRVTTCSDTLFNKGPAADAVVRTSVLRGMLNHCKDLTVSPNLVNADTLAAARGWVVESELAPLLESSADRPSVTVQVETDKTLRSVSGTLIARQPYITQVDQWPSFPVFKASGNFVFYSAIDRPGVIAPVLSVLASNGINVSNMGVARPAPGRPSFVFVSLTSKLNRAVADKISALKGIDDMVEVRL